MNKTSPLIQSALITGGARSGKSVFAEDMVLKQSSHPIYIATAEIFDEEMKSRVELHQKRRGENWNNIFAPIDLPQALIQTDGGETRLVDCLTYWVNNLIYHKQNWQSALDELVDTLSFQKSPVIFVTNEIGMGVIPETSLGREFRDIAGTVNQAIATQVEEMYLLVSGRAIKIPK